MLIQMEAGQQYFHIKVKFTKFTKKTAEKTILRQVIYIYIYTTKAKRNLFACVLSGMAGHALYGMAPCFGHTGVTFDAENDRPSPGSLRGHFEATQDRFLRLKALF